MTPGDLQPGTLLMWEWYSKKFCMLVVSLDRENKAVVVYDGDKIFRSFVSDYSSWPAYREGCMTALSPDGELLVGTRP